ncbi:hypothetical protein ABIA16_000616 [Sinorhizobium fredii]
MEKESWGLRPLIRPAGHLSLFNGEKGLAAAPKLSPPRAGG